LNLRRAPQQQQKTEQGGGEEGEGKREKVSASEVDGAKSEIKVEKGCDPE